MSADLWVARAPTRDLWQYRFKSEATLCAKWGKTPWDAGFSLPDRWFPEIAPGECRRVTLTLSPAPAPDTRTEGE